MKLLLLLIVAAIAGVFLSESNFRAESARRSARIASDGIIAANRTRQIAEVDAPYPPPPRSLQPPAPAPKKEEATDAVRQFEMIVQQIVPGGGIGLGAFYEADARRQAGRVFMAGLPAGIVDGNMWRGWAEPAGAKTYTAVSGALTTVRAWRVVPAPKAPPHKQGDWLPKNSRNPLDPPRRRY